MSPVAHLADELLIGFTRALRAAGVPVTQDRSRGFLTAAALVGAGDRAAIYRAGRATLCSGPDELVRYDQVFAAWFDEHEALPDAGESPRSSAPAPTSLPELESDGPGEDEESSDVAPAVASAVEVLRHRDVADLSAAEKQRLTRLFARLRPRAPRRRTSRHHAWHRGELDMQRTLRATLRRFGEPAEIAWRRPANRPRRVVLLLDISGSMSGYAEALLRLGHRFVVAPGAVPVEAFTIGTRLTRITRALRQPDAEQALAAAGDMVPDWSGGTRLGESLQAFTDRFGARGLARGAVVVVCSDGWERGDTGLLAEQMSRLHRLAHRIVWVNPHRGKHGYEPIQTGVLAVLPFVDDFVSGHSLATYEHVMEVVENA